MIFDRRRRFLKAGPLFVEAGSGLHVWMGMRGVHIYWRHAGLNVPVVSVGPLRLIPERLVER